VNVRLSPPRAQGRKRQLFDVTASEPRVLVGAAFGLLIVAGVAAWLPARRAARIELALRAE
jgi:hypothetical protein